MFSKSTIKKRGPPLVLFLLGGPNVLRYISRKPCFKKQPVAGVVVGVYRVFVGKVELSGVFEDEVLAALPLRVLVLQIDPESLNVFDPCAHATAAASHTLTAGQIPTQGGKTLNGGWILGTLIFLLPPQHLLVKHCKHERFYSTVVSFLLFTLTSAPFLLLFLQFGYLGVISPSFPPFSFRDAFSPLPPASVSFILSSSRVLFENRPCNYTFTHTGHVFPISSAGSPVRGSWRDRIWQRNVPA